MKKMVCFSIFIAIIATFSSCRQHYDAFPQALTTYFPYTENQNLMYTNNKGNITSLKITEMYVSKKYSQPFGVKCGGAEMHFSAKNDTMSIHGSMEVPCMSDGEAFGIIINLSAGNVEYVKDFIGDAYSAQMLSQIGDTIRFSKDDCSAIVVRYEGLVEFYDIPRDCTWTLIK